jgi:glycosyltransferase involved in cell wall biosynthesis
MKNSHNSKKISICLISFSDFGLGRAEYLAKAMKLMNLEVLVITNKQVRVTSPENFKNMLDKREIDTINVPLPPLPYDNLLLRLIQYILFTFISSLILLRIHRSFDIYYSRGPQPFTDIVCYIVKCFKGGRIISDITDLWPDSLNYVKMNNILKHFLVLVGHAINFWAYSKLDVIVTHNELMANILSKRSKKRVYVLHGVIDIEKFKPMSKEKIMYALPKNLQEKLDKKFIVLYAGLLGPFQNPEIILKIARIMVDKEVLFIIIGTGPLIKELIKKMEKWHLNNVLLLGPVHHSIMPLLYNVASVCILTYKQTNFLRIGLPKKFIEYAAVGKPILCITPSCVASKLCVDWKAGYHVPINRLKDAVYILENLKNNKELRILLGNNARKMAQSLFSLENAKNCLQIILDSINL